MAETTSEQIVGLRAHCESWFGQKKLSDLENSRMSDLFDEKFERLLSGPVRPADAPAFAGLMAFLTEFDNGDFMYGAKLIPTAFRRLSDALAPQAVLNIAAE